MAPADISEDSSIKPEMVDTALGEMKLEESSTSNASGLEEFDTNEQPEAGPTSTCTNKSRSPSPQPAQPIHVKKQSASQTPTSMDDEEQEMLGAEGTVKLGNGKPTKLSRKSSQKVISRPAPLFDPRGCLGFPSNSRLHLWLEIHGSIRT